MNKIKWLFFFLFIFAALGYFREFFFVHLNNIMYQIYYQRDTVLAVPDCMSVFKQFSYNTLYYSKYLFTLFSALIFFFANYFALKKLTNISFLIKLLNYTYVILLLFAALSMTYGYFINGRLQDDEYTLSRWLMGIAQSPIICLILVASEKLYTKSFPS